MTTFADYSAAKIAALSLNQVAAMTAEQWATVTPVAFAGVTAAQLARFSTAQIQILSLKQIGAITAAAMAGLSAAQVAVLPVVAVAAFSAAQLAAMLSTTIAALTAAQLANVSVVNLSGLSAQQVAAISTAARSGLSDQQKNALLTVTVRQEAKRMFANDAARRRGDDDSMLIATIQLKQGTVELDRAVKEASGVAIVGNSSAKMTISGTIAQINAAVNGLIFVVPANFSGTTGLDVAVKYKDLDVTLPKAQNTNGDTTLVFNKANGNAITVADVDATYLTAIYTFYIKVQGGTLALSRTATGMGVDLIAGNSGLLARGTVAEINNALDGLIFTPLKDYNGISDLQIVDSRGEFRSITVNVVAVDDAAVIGGTSTATLTESNAVLTAKGRLTLTDVDSEVSANPFKAQSDIIGKGKYGEFNLAKDGSWTYETTSAHNNFVAGQTYIDSLDVEANDGTKGKITVNIVGTNDAPVITALIKLELDINNSFVFSSSSGGVGAITVGDVDSDRMDIKVGVANGALSFANLESGATTTSLNQNKDVWLQGTRDQVNKALNGLIYNSKSSSGDTVTVLARDGTATAEKRIRLQAYVNKAPKVTTSVTETFNEDTALVFSGANKNAITVADVDSTALTTTVTASEGTLTLGSLVLGATIKAGANKSASITLSGTALQINAALEGLTYTPLLNANGQKTLTVTTSDGALSSTQTVKLTIAAVNDAAIISGTSTASLTESDAVLTAKGRLTLTDVDSDISANPFKAQTRVAGNNNHGEFIFESDGSWNYKTTSAHNDFVANKTYTDSLDVEAKDGTTGKITVSIVGTNDAPVFKLADAQTFDHTKKAILPFTPASTTLDNTFSVEITVTPGRAIILPAQSQGGVIVLNDYLLFPEQGGANAGFGMTVGTNGVVVSEHGDSQLAPLLVWAGAVSAGTKLAVVVTDKTPRLYVNGTLVATGLRSKRNTLFVRPGSGIGGGGHGYYSGAASDLRYWDKALSATEVATNYQQQPSLYAANLNAVYLSSTGNKNTITENLANGTVVGQVFATDIDSPTLEYSLKGAGSDAFAINANSGEIRVKDATKLGNNSFGVNRQVALDVTVSDGATAVVKTQMFTLAKINEAPVVTAPGVQKFNEDTARVFSSANGNAITVSDVETTAVTSLNFDGTSASHLAVADTKLSGDITLEAWVNTDDPRSRVWQNIFDFGNRNSVSNRIFFGFKGESGKLWFQRDDNGDDSYSITADTALGSGWHHVAASVSAAGVATMYVDGTSVASGYVGTVASVTRSNNYIGRTTRTKDPLLQSQIRDVRIWDIERSQAQIQAEMRALSNPDAAGLRAWYPMNETTGNTVANAAVVTVADGLSAADVVLVNTAVARPVAVTPITQTITQTTTLTTVLTTTVTTTEGTLALDSTNSGASITAGANNSASITLSGTALQINAALEGLTYTPLPSVWGLKTISVTTSDGSLLGSKIITLDITAGAALAGWTAAQVAALSTAAVSALSFRQIGSLSAAAVGGFTPQQIPYISKVAVAAFTAQHVPALSVAAVGALTKVQTSFMSSAALMGLTTEQVASLSLSAVSGLTSATLAALTAAPMPTLKANLTFEEFLAAKGIFINAPTQGGRWRNEYGAYEGSWTTYKAAQLPAFSPAQVAALAPAAIGGLTITQLYRFSAEQLKALTAAQIAELPKSQTSTLSAEQINMLSVDARLGLVDVDVTGYSAVQLQALSNTQVSRITLSSLALLTPSVFARLLSTQIQHLSASQIAVLSGAQATAMTAAQLSALSATQVAALQISVVQDLRQEQISAMSSAALIGLTAAQVSALSSNAMSGITSRTLAGLSYAEMPTTAEGLTDDEFFSQLEPSLSREEQVGRLKEYRTSWRTFNAKQLSRLNPEQISAITPDTLGQLTVAELLHFSNEQLEFFTLAQRATLRTPNGDVLTVEGLTMPRVNIAASSAAVIASWSTRQLKLLSVEQWTTVTAEQAGSVNPTALAGLTTAEIFARIPKAQLKGLRTAHYMAWPERTRNALTSAQLSSLGGNFLKEMTTQNLMGLTAAQRQGLSADQVQSFATYAVFGLTSVDLNQVFADGFFAKFSGLQARQLAPEALAAINSAPFTFILNANFQGLLSTQIKALPNSVWAKATSAALNAMQILSFQAITATQIAAVPANVISGLSQNRRSELTTVQVGGLTGIQINANSSLTGLQVAGLSGAQLAKINANILATLSVTQLAVITSDAIGSLTALQLAALSPDKIRALTTVQVAALSTSAVVGLTSAQFLAMTQTQIAAITVAQKAALNNRQQEYLATALQTLADDLRVAKLLYADVWILLTSNRTDPDKNNGNDDAKNQWDIVKTALDPEDNTEIKLFKYGSRFDKDQIIPLPIALGARSWQSSLKLEYNLQYSGSDELAPPHLTYPRTQLAAFETDVANILSYGSDRSLQFARSISLSGILEYSSGGGYINSNNIHYLSGKAVSALSTKAFTTLLKVNAYWGSTSFKANSHKAGAVSSDNPFGVGVIKNLSSENLTIYIAELNTHYAARTSNASLSSLFSDELFSELSDTQKLTFLNTSLYKFSPTQLQSLSADLVGKISGATLKNLVDVRPDLLKSFTQVQIGTLLKAAIEQLAEKVVNFTADQFLAFTGLQIMGIESPAAWRAVVADYSDIAQSYIDKNPVYLSGGAISTLSPSEIARLPSIVVRNLSEANMKAFGVKLVTDLVTGKIVSQVGSLTVAHVALLSKEQLGWLGNKISSLAKETIQILTTEQLKGVSKDLIEKLPVKPIVLMSSDEIATVTVNSLLNFSGKAIVTLSNAQLASMTKKQALNLLPSQYLALPAEQFKLLKATPVTMMSKAQLQALTVDDIKSLHAAQFELFSAGQLRAMRTDQIQALSEEQIKGLQSWTIGGLQATTLSKFTNTQVAFLTEKQLISVDSAVANELSNKWSALLKAGSRDVLEKIKTPNARIPKELRSVYIISNLARSSQSFYDTFSSQLLRKKVPGAELMKSDAETEQQKKVEARDRSVYWAQYQFQQNQKESAFTRQTLQKGRAIGSALALGSVISAAGMANQASKDGDHLTAFVYSLAGMAYFASLLQVPVSELVSYSYKLSELKGKLSSTNDPALITSLQKELDDHRKLGKSKWGYESFTTPSDNEKTIAARDKPIVGLDAAGVLAENIKWRRHESLTWKSDTKRSASVVFMVADVLGLGYSAYQLGTAIQSGDKVKIGFGVADLVGNSLVLLGDGVDFVWKPKPTISISQSRMLGSGLIIIQLASTGSSLYSNAKYYIDNPKNNRARDALIIDVFVQAALLAATVFSLVFPAFAVPIMIVVLFLPNAAAIRAVQELKDQQTSFNHQGRTVWGNTILASLIKVAEMNVNAITAVVNTFTAELELKNLRKQMAGEKMQQLLGQDYKHYLESEMAPSTEDASTAQVYQKTLRIISNDIEKSLSSKEAGAIKIAAFVNIMRRSADEANYYVSEKSNILTYASRMDVRKNKANGTVDFDAGAFGLAKNDNTMQTTISDVAGTEKDSLIIVNVSSEERLANKKEIIITDTTANNRVNYYITADNARVLSAKNSSSVITIVEGQATNAKVTSLSGKDIVNYSGASLDENGAIKLVEDVTLWNVINLDNYINVAAVIAGATTVHNSVIGTNAKQNYSFNNGRDNVSMSGGQGAVVVGGRETVLKMAGGNNFASVKLGGRVDGMAWAADAAAGVYDGGAAVAATGTIGGEGYLYGTNIINFAEAYASLKIDIIDPKSSGIDTTYSTYSKVTTQGLDLEDIGAFRNFQLVMGSNFGDTIKVTGTSTLQSLTLGMGQNSVVIKDVKAPAETSASDKSVLMITALISLNAAPSDITVDNSDVRFEGSVNSNNLVQVVNTSSFVGALRGNDRIFTDKNSGNLVKVAYAEGQHVLNLHGGVAEVLMFSDSSGDAVITVDEHATTEITTALILSGNQLTQMVFRDSEGLHFSLGQTNGDAQEVDYSFGNETSDLANNKLTVVKLFKSDKTQVAVTVAALSDAINALSGAANYSATSSTYNFDTVYNQAVLMNPKA